MISRTVRQEQLRNIWAIFASQIVDYGTKLTRTKFMDLSFLKTPLKNFPQDKLKNILSVFKRPAVIIALATIVILSAGVLFLKDKVNNSAPQVFGNSQTNFSPQKSTILNRKFEIPIRNSSGKITGSALPITITTVDSSKKILIQGKPATSRDGKVFLILNLDIDNATTNQLSIRPVDFIRLQDDQGKSYAPDVHNEVVKAEPISIKKTRVGFVVDENQTKFKFLVGEIGGNPETVEITL